MRSRVWLLLGLLACGISWFYAMKVLLPWDDYMGKQHGGLKAQMGDLYPRWVGARELLLHGRNPYGPEISHEIQIAYYGHTVPPNNVGPGHKIIDEQRFAYPVYVVFLMAPTMYADFASVQRWAPLVLGFFAALTVPLCLDLLGWRLPWEAITAITLFSVSSPQIVQALEHQQLTVVVGFLLIAGAWYVGRNHLATAGVLLACSTIKPQMALFPLCFFLVWVVGDWSRRWRLLAGFGATLTILIGTSELILPGWIGYFIEGAAAYRKYFPTTSPLRVALGDTLGELVGGVIVLGLLIFAWHNRRESAGSREFINILAAFLVGTILVFPLFTPFNQVLLILPAMLVLQDWKFLPRFSRLVFIGSVSWPWVTSLALLLFPPHLNSPDQLPLLPSFLTLFFPIFLPLLLMARRGASVAPEVAATDLPSS